MSNIPTAEQFLKKYLGETYKSSAPIEQYMIEFAKFHVEAALKEIVEDYCYYLEGDEGSERVNAKKFLKEAYPLTNIK